MAGDTISGTMGRGRESEGEVGMNGINDDDTDSLLDLSVEDSGVGIGGLGNTTGRDNIDVIGGESILGAGREREGGCQGRGEEDRMRGWSIDSLHAVAKSGRHFAVFLVRKFFQKKSEGTKV